jgi:hypothetical protein
MTTVRDIASVALPLIFAALVAWAIFGLLVDLFKSFRKGGHN